MIQFARSLALSLALGIAAAHAQSPLTLVKDGKSDYVIVIAHGAPPATARGAKELQTHLAQITGAELPIIDDRGTIPEHAIIVGPGRHTPPLDPAALGDDGFVLRTQGSRLIIAGTGRRGSMYGCSTLLEKIGVRWFTPTVTHIPARSTITLPAMNETQVPAFEYRDPFFTEAFDKDWAARNKVVGAYQRLDDSTGGKFEYAEFVHSLDKFIPQSLFESRPEYFPLIGGRRVGGYVQRCLSNPDVLALAIAGVRKAFQQYPKAVICSVSQNDCANWCRCDHCQRLTDLYGAHSGLYLWFVNQVAEAIETDHPGKLIDTIAYQFTEQPPTGIAPRHNVRIRLCPINVCQAHPYELDDHPASRAFVRNLDAWHQLAGSLYIWHYNTDFAHYLMPFPNFDEFPASARLYQRRGVKGVFFQGAYAPGGGGSDAELRSYVMAKLLWDTRIDTDALVTEWMQGVYGDGWIPMRQWFDLVHQQVRRPGIHLGIYDAPGSRLFSARVLAQGDMLFDLAASLASPGPQRSYVEKARLSLRYVKLFQRRGSDEVLRNFIADAKHFGITSFREGQTIEEWERIYRTQSAPMK